MLLHKTDAQAIRPDEVEKGRMEGAEDHFIREPRRRVWELDRNGGESAARKGNKSNTSYRSVGESRYKLLWEIDRPILLLVFHKVLYVHE